MWKLIFIGKHWLINCSYNPHKGDICRHLETVTKKLDAHYSKYENIIFFGGFDAGTPDTPMVLFRESYNLTNIIIEPTCFKNPEKSSCSHFILTTKSVPFQSACVIERQDYLIFVG